LIYAVAVFKSAAAKQSGNKTRNSNDLMFQPCDTTDAGPAASIVFITFLVYVLTKCNIFLRFRVPVLASCYTWKFYDIFILKYLD
jgi:uncharacterized protein YybS (DUF2232 family)